MKPLIVLFATASLGLLASVTARAGDPAPPAGSTVSPEPPKDVADVNEDRMLRQQGYKPEMRRGVQYYCRREAPLGSRFEQVRCLTLAQSREMRQHSKDLTEHAQRDQGSPAGS